jgi:monoamine oxidase
MDAWPVLREPVGRVHFAGEHTETLAGYMESAVRSGHRVAAAIGAPAGTRASGSPPRASG